MKSTLSKVIACTALFTAGGFLASQGINETPVSMKTTPTTKVVLQVDTNETAVEAPQAEAENVIVDENVQLCQGAQCGCVAGTCDGGCGNAVVANAAYAYQPGRTVHGVDHTMSGNRGRETRWRQGGNVQWEEFAYGEYIGPHRTPHVPVYRLRVNDSLEFVYLRTREKSTTPYQLFVGDQISIASAIDPSLTQENLTVRSDGMISVSLIGQISAAGKTVEDLQRELNEKYTKFVKNPAIVVRVIQGDTPLQDLVDSVDARQGSGGQSRLAVVAPDGTVQLPGIGSVPAVGLTLNEIGREVNARYRLRQGGIEVTPILTQRAPRFVYVVGEVGVPGRFEMVGPTTAMQAIALAQGSNPEGNLRQAIVFRRDQNWRLTATLLDLNGALLGRRPQPSDDIWLRDSDIVLIPKKPITRMSEAVNQYFTQTLYGLFPAQLGSFDASAFVN